MTNKKVIIDGVEYVPKVEGVEAKEWPRDGEEYFYLDSANVIDRTTWEADPDNQNDYDIKRGAIRNVFPTEQKAEYERLRRECMATRWIPEDGESFYSAMQMEKKWQIHSCLSKELVLLGLAAPTKEEAQARWDMYGEAWLDALKP